MCFICRFEHGVGGKTPEKISQVQGDIKSLVPENYRKYISFDKNEGVVFDYKQASTDLDITLDEMKQEAGKSVKGINILSAFYHSSDDSLSAPIRIPIMYELVLKTILYSVVKTKKTKRKTIVREGF